MTDDPLLDRGGRLGELVWKTIAHAQANAPRTLQADSRVLGMSDLGGCREYIRATIAGDPGSEPGGLKMAAYAGTAIGDKIEADVKAALAHAATQRRVTLELDVDGTKVMVSGSSDLFFLEPYEDEVLGLLDPGVLDLKSRDGLAEVRREGASFKERVQISGYLVAAIQEGFLQTDAIGVLLFFDRSGKDRGFHTWTIDYAGALRILEAAKARLGEVAASLATARHAPRDEPESWCWNVGCRFYAACWTGYQPTGAIEHERELDAVRRYTEARRDQKDVVKRLDAAKADLEFVEGVTPDGVSVTWSEMSNGARRIDVREPK